MTNELSKVSATREIPVAAVTIFELLRNPERHAETDATGSVQSVDKGQGIREVGDTFTMNMVNPDGPYKTQNEVFAYQQDRVIGWQNQENLVNGVKVGAKLLYELEPINADNTRVTLTYDPTEIDNPEVQKLAKEKFAVESQLEDSLAKLAEAVA